MIYSFYIYGRNGTCLYYEEWNRKTPSKNLVEDQKLLFGLVYGQAPLSTPYLIVTHTLGTN